MQINHLGQCYHCKNSDPLKHAKRLSPLGRAMKKAKYVSMSYRSSKMVINNAPYANKWSIL